MGCDSSFSIHIQGYSCRGYPDNVGGLILIVHQTKRFIMYKIAKIRCFNVFIIIEFEIIINLTPVQ